MVKGNDNFMESAYALEYLADIGGAKSIDIVNELKENPELDEFELSETLNMDVKAIRRILYRLYEQKLVSFRKTRDKERGWYIYIWRLEPKKFTALLEDKKKEVINKLKSQLTYESGNQFFKCINGCMRIPFERAFEFEFTCPECGRRLEHFENEAIIRQLKKYVEQLESGIGG